MRIYISGPISGTTDFKERFRLAAERLTKLGIDFVNPAELYKTMPGAKHEDYIKVCASLLGTCDVVLMLPGFNDSKGCMKEYELAKRLGLPIWMDLLGTLPKYDESV